MAHTPNIAAVFRAVLTAFENGDFDKAVAHFAEDAVVVDFSAPTERLCGRAAIGSLMGSFKDLIPDLQFEIASMTTAGSMLAAEIVGRGTPRGYQEPIELHYGVFDEFRGGQIVSEHVYGDSGQLPPALLGETA
ncbi:hypothetical protein JCM18899A_54520 [Nocardioides sp. AN3]